MLKLNNHVLVLKNKDNNYIANVLGNKRGEIKFYVTNELKHARLVQAEDLDWEAVDKYNMSVYWVHISDNNIKIGGKILNERLDKEKN